MDDVTPERVPFGKTARENAVTATGRSRSENAQSSRHTYCSIGASPTET